MGRASITTSDGVNIEIEVDNGDSLMSAAVSAGLDGIVGECGGNAMCATCHVYVAEPDLDRLPRRSEVEEEMLESTAEPGRPNSRLSCQIVMSDRIDGLTVHLPATQY